MRTVSERMAIAFAKAQLTELGSMIVEVLITQRDGKHPLADQRLDLMLDQLGAPAVMEAGGEALHQADRPIGVSCWLPPRQAPVVIH
jgi:hypothetical protein